MSIFRQVHQITGQSTASTPSEEFPQFWPADFGSGSGDLPPKDLSLGSILSMSFAKIMKSEIGLQKYSDVIILSFLASGVILPACHYFLGDQWMQAFLPMILVMMVLIISNKK